MRFGIDGSERVGWVHKIYKSSLEKTWCLNQFSCLSLRDRFKNDFFHPNYKIGY